MGKYDIICDSSSIISLTDSCLMNVFYFLSDKFPGKFVIPRSVENESVKRPMGMKSHAMGAVLISKAIEEGALNVYEESVQGEGEEVMNLANSCFFAGRRPLRLVQEGEAQVLACAAKLKSAHVLMDERTMRMICEEPSSLARHFEQEFGRGVRVDVKALGRLRRIVGRPTFIRSTELLVVAYEKGFFRHFGRMEPFALQASLYSLKFAGASTGFDEIDRFVKGIKPSALAGKEAASST